MPASKRCLTASLLRSLNTFCAIAAASVEMSDASAVTMCDDNPLGSTSSLINRSLTSFSFGIGISRGTGKRVKVLISASVLLMDASCAAATPNPIGAANEPTGIAPVIVHALTSAGVIQQLRTYKLA